MTEPVPYWHVDAFADRPFAGNQAAVMTFAAWPDDATMQAIAAENMFAETAFLIPDTRETGDVGGVGDWQLRWFAPIGEVRLCGHATLAAGHVLLSREPARDAVRLATRWSGVLEVRRGGTAYALGLAAISTAPGSYDEALAAVGGHPHEIWRSPDGYTAFLYATADEVLALTPDFRALAGLGDEQFIATAPGRNTDVLSRVFVPGSGIDEDSVTGSAHAVLAPIWARRLGRDRFTALQASQRGGRMACRLDGDRVWIEGQCVTLVEGQYYL